jgi:hypothetical protein
VTRAALAWTGAAAVLLALPMLALYAQHWGLSIQQPTGFLQYDQVYYAANARQYVDQPGLSLAYGLPFSVEADTPRIYFQPLTVVMGLLLALTGASAGAVYSALGCVLAIFMMFAAIVALRTAAPVQGAGGAVLTALFAWGGGLLVLAGGALVLLARGTPEGVPDLAAFYHTLFAFDPGDGFWLLNLGRNAYFATEALYHALVLLALAALATARWKTALALLAVLAASHPFTGLQVLAVAAAWLLLEVALDRKAQPAWPAAAAGLLLALHVVGYLVLMPALSPEHRVLQQQWTLPWTLWWPSSLLALAPLLALTLWRARRREERARMLGLPRGRLYLVLFAVTVVLSHHELFTTPRQPVHFDHGYGWIGLFLLNADYLARLLRGWLATAPGTGLVVAVLLLGLLDNVAWLSRFPAQRAQGRDPAQWVTLDPVEAAVLADLAELGRRAPHEPLLLSSDARLAYLATTGTPFRPWYAHPYLTPLAMQRAREMRDAFVAGACEPRWAGRPTAYLWVRRTAIWALPNGGDYPAAVEVSAPPPGAALCGAALVKQTPDYALYANF